MHETRIGTKLHLQAIKGIKQDSCEAKLRALLRQSPTSSKAPAGRDVPCRSCSRKGGRDNPLLLEEIKLCKS
ncbi:unnamed protein product [Dovyalis caffra]|uniref:Uncharacterized protein n=1 Tax=Dovyalis caffra TaxID=77055 RepID=A0AAV1QQF9_9ROSI|nr:unnamed protein product [Dovyalis caffra]